MGIGGAGCSRALDRQQGRIRRMSRSCMTIKELFQEINR